MKFSVLAILFVASIMVAGTMADTRPHFNQLNGMLKSYKEVQSSIFGTPIMLGIISDGISARLQPTASVVARSTATVDMDAMAETLRGDRSAIREGQDWGYYREVTPGYTTLPLSATTEQYVDFLVNNVGVDPNNCATPTTFSCAFGGGYGSICVCDNSHVAVVYQYYS